MKDINVSISYILHVSDTETVEEIAKDTAEKVFKFTSFWLDGRELVVKAEHARYPFERCTIRTERG